MALILLISASNWGSAVCARSVKARNRQTSATAVLINMEECPQRLARERVNLRRRECKAKFLALEVYAFHNSQSGPKEPIRLKQKAIDPNVFFYRWPDEDGQ